MDNNRLSALLAKKMAGEATPEEERELQDYLQWNANDRFWAEILHTFWAAGAKSGGSLPTDADTRFQEILQKASRPERAVWTSFISRRVIAAAAVLLLGLVALRFWPAFLKTEQKEAHINEIVIERGAKSKVTLPDGTQVWLNSDSKLKYPDVFNDTLREVTLEGEGYFIVAKNPDHPFVLHTSEIDIHVIGTVFNVKSYADEDAVETTLLQGSIAVEKRNATDAARIMLRPHEKLVIRKKNTVLQTSASGAPEDNKSTPSEKSSEIAPLLSVTRLSQLVPDSTRTETSWVYGRLVFEGDHFNELAVKMERWYNLKITIRDEKVAQYRFTGMLENETLEEALHALQLTASFRFRIDGNQVYIDKP
ncbi:MAG: FecR family protein [Bacteroidetes bacterium]|nr:FecR family protein [Bacteroidota bacterium]